MARPRKTEAIIEDEGVLREVEDDKSYDTQPAIHAGAGSDIDQVAASAYEKMRVELADQGAFPSWNDLPSAAREQYLSAARNCLSREPRTRYEEIVKEVLNNG